MASRSPKVWFITGCSSGFGAALTEEILNRGDKVIATARNISKLDKLKEAGADVMQVDVTATLDELRNVAQKAHDLYGRIDYLINNAGYGMQGTIEELTPEETQKQFETNVFGLLNVTRSILPFMRGARSGVIGNVSSIGAWRGSAAFGMYCASKWAVSGLSETMAFELEDFGIKVCSIEPGYFRSSFLNPGNRQLFEDRIPDYNGTTARKVADLLNTIDNNQPGDPIKGVKVIVDVLTRRNGREIPLRLPLGSDAYVWIKGKCEETITLLDEWKEVMCSTDHDDVREQQLVV